MQIRRTPLAGLDMNMQAQLRARRPVRPAVRPRIIPPRPGVAKPAGPTVDPLWTKANNQVMTMMNPMLARLASQRVAAEANARAVAGQHGQALGGALQASAKPMDESFNRGIVSAAAVEDALAKRLGNVGGQAQQGLSQQLAQIGAQDTGEIAKTYQGAANAGFATGSADLQRLIAQRAAAGEFQAKLPGIGLLEGNRDLAQALSEMRNNFGEQERGLQDQAVEQSFDLFNQLRGEKREDQQAKAEALANQQELYMKDKMALRALAATAQTQADKLKYAAYEKDLDRKNAQEIARIRAETSMYGVDTRAATAAANRAAKPTKQPSLTGPASQKFITVNGKLVKNPNYVPSAVSGGFSGSQSGVVRNEILQSLLNGEGLIRSRFALGTPDAKINREINRIFDARKVPKAERPKLRKIIFESIDGRRMNVKKDGVYGTYKSPAWGLR